MSLLAKNTKETIKVYDLGEGLDPNEGKQRSQI